MKAGRPTTTTSADPTGQAVFNLLQSKLNKVTFKHGVIIDFVSSTHGYVVSSGDSGRLWCTVGGEGSFNPFGPKSISTYTLGSRVIYVQHSDNPFIGTIIGTDPSPLYSRENSVSDYLWPFLRSGVASDTAHQEPIESANRIGTLAGFPGGVDLPDLSGGRPVDATSAGEKGFLSETGVGIFTDSWHAGIRADEFTGVWTFYPNQLTRVSGLNLQLWSSVEERHDVDDEGELQKVTRKCVYPWENVGAWYWNQITEVRNIGASGQNAINYPWQLTQDGSGRTGLDSERYDTIPAARGYEFGGYLGQGGSDSVAAPLQFSYSHPLAKESLDSPIIAFTEQDPEQILQLTGLGLDYPVLDNTAYGFTEEGYLEGNVYPITNEDGTNELRFFPEEAAYKRVPPNNLREPTGFQPGLLTESKSLTGAYHLASAKRIIIAKRASLPTPRQRRRPEDPDGDKQIGLEGYAFSGNKQPPLPFGAPPSIKDWNNHKVVGELPTLTEGRSSAAIADILAYVFNWERLHPFAYHHRDWDVPEEGLAGSHLVNQAIPAFARLVCAQHLADPPPVKLDIDHRYGEVDYYPTEVVVALLDDGSYHVHDGYGNEFNCGPGGISLDSPGDINIRAGRNINMWAGHDLIMRARDSMDLTTSAHDIRMAARRNMQLVGGTSGCGGILLESQAVCPGYKFTDSVGEEVNTSGIMMIAPHSQIVGLADDVIMKTINGRIIMDSGEDGVIRHIAGYHHQVIHETAIQMFADGDEVQSANEFKNGSNSFGAATTVRGTVRATGNLAQATGGEATTIHNKNNYIVNDYGDKVLAAQSIPTEGLLAEFTLRTDEEYMTYDWSIWRPRWMTLAEESGQTLPVWEEPTVKSRIQEFEQFPFPGTALVAPDSMKISKPFLADPDRGWVGVPRRPVPDSVNPTYEEPIPPPVITMPLNNSYLVIVPNDNPCASVPECDSNNVPTPQPDTFEYQLQGGWGWPNEGKEGNINDLVREGYWPIEPPTPQPDQDGSFEGEMVSDGQFLAQEDNNDG